MSCTFKEIQSVSFKIEKRENYYKACFNSLLYNRKVILGLCKSLNSQCESTANKNTSLN